jgi:hypothetical protein
MKGKSNFDYKMGASLLPREMRGVWKAGHEGI